MNLKFDPVDVFGAGCWDAISRIFLFVSSIFMGCGIASWALFADNLLDEPLSPFFAFLVGPLHLFSAWALLAFPVMICGWFVMIRSEENLAPRWAGFAVVMGLFCMLGQSRSIGIPWISWPVWILLSAMLCTATWFFMQWQRNRWIQEMAELKAENEQRRLEIQEKFGTAATTMYSNDES
jgi:hypothetical protein